MGILSVTDEMIERGAHEILAYDPEDDAARVVVGRVLNAVFGCEVVPVHEVAHVSADIEDFFRDFAESLNRY